MCSCSSYFFFHMAKMAAEPVCGRTPDSSTPFSSKWQVSSRRNKSHTQIPFSTIRASHSMDDKNKVYKELGLFSLRKKIEDSVLRVEMLAPTALELEEGKRIEQEEMVHECNLWDDYTKSNEILAKLANSAKVVDALKDLAYKAEEAKLITQLAEMDAINYGLFKQAYNASVDVSKFLDQYEMLKLLRGSYDMEGACVVIKAGSSGLYSEIWVKQLLSMYIKWAKKQGYKGRVVEKLPKNGGIMSATIEFEFGYAYGHLSGERGVHHMIRSSHNESVLQEVSSAGVEVIPLFLETASDLQIDDEDLMISSPSSHAKVQGQAEPAVCIQHIPSGISVQSSGERNHFANKMKALNRLKAKLLVVAREQGVSDARSIKRDAIVDMWQRETRRRVVSRTGGQVGNGYEKGIVEKSEIYRDRNDVEENERKRSKLDVFEFDEYDAMDGKRLKTEFMDDSDDDEDEGGSFFGSKSAGGSGIRREFETGGSKGDIVYKRKHSYFDSSSSLMGERNMSSDRSMNKRFEMKRDGARVPVLLRDKFGDTSEEPIRLQGRNGVLKVMPNKNKKGSGVLKTYDHLGADDYRKGLRSVDTVKKNELVRPSFYSEPKVHEKPGSSDRAKKNKLNLRKSLPTKNSKALDWESDDSDTSLKLGPNKLEGKKSVKIVRSKDEMTPPSANTPLTGSNEGKIKRGSGTEKQKLREQIRKMLLDAGWTIDYRPRKNRDYQDAVYVNPSGTAYWSIIKAYDALQKQFGEEDNNVKPSGECSSFSPISEDVLNKLTRQTRKKIEKEMRKKHRDACGTKNARETALKKSANKHDRKSMGNDRAEEKLSTYLKQGGKSWKGKGNENVFSGSNMDMDMDSHDSTHLSREANHLSEDNKTGNLSIHGRKSRKLGRCTLVVRSTSKGVNSETDGYIPYTGKRTLLSWLIDTGTVGLSEKVQYMNRRQTRVMQEGWITRDGIHCGCCSKILSVSKFEIHAGSKLRQPFQNIYLESGSSLLQCQIDAWNRQEESERSSFLSVFVDGDDPNDDTCGLCGDGGDLICCDGCPSTFHQNCLGIQMLPPGDWHCPNCTCKFCRMAGGSSAEENDSSGCALLKCDLCEKKYHQSCIQDVDAFRVDSNTPPSFCGQKCRELFENLQKFLGVKHELEAGFTWSLIHRTDTDSDTSHRGFPQRVECNSKLAVALTVMDECFLPIVDRRSGINLIHNVLYNCGSNFNRLNFSGFYTAILERGDEIISAASIRIHGTQLAEMPFIGTRHIYRHQGMCRRLFYAIESALCSFKVEKMIIPAISELMHTWTEVFGFNYLEESQKKDLRYMNILVFPGIDMLQKLLIEEENNHQDVTTSTGAKAMKLEGKHSSMPEMLNKSDKDSLVENNLPVCGDALVRHVGGTDDKVADPDSASLGPGVTLNDASVPSTSLDAPHEVKVPVSSEEIICSNGQSGEKLPESAAESKSSFPADASNVVQEKTHEDEPDRTGVKPMELERKHSLMPEMLIKPDKDSLVEHDLHACDDDGVHHVGGTDDNVGASESASQSQGLTFNDASVPSTSIDASHVVKVPVSSEEVFCSNTQSGEKAPEAATESKSFYPADSSNLVQDTIGSPVDDNLKSSGEDDMDILTVGASDSGSQSQGVTLSDTSVPSTSLDAPDVIKVHVSCEEILCSNAQSGDKVPEAATESKSFYPVDSSNLVQETEDSPILDSPVDCSLKSSAEGDMDVLKVGASASASQSQGVTSNHVSVPNTSLAAPHVLKVPVSSEEIMCLDAQSGEKVPEAATDSLSIFPADCTNLVQEMEDNPTLNSLVDGNFKSGASDSAFQSGQVTLNDVVLSTSLDAPDVVKLPVSGEIRCSNAQSGGKVPEAASESKSFYPADSSNLVQVTDDNPILISPVDGNLKSCAEGDMDVLNVSNVDASVEPHSHSFEKVFSQISMGVADENKNDISASLHGIDESTMEVNSDLDRCNPCEKENKIFESSEVTCGARGCNNSIGHASGDCSGTGVWEMKTCSQSGHNLSESAPDSGSHAFEVITRSQSGENLVESASTSKCLSPSNMNEAASKMENNLALHTLVGSDTQSSSLSYIDGVGVNNNVACAEPAALSTSPEVSAYNNSTEVVSEDEKATYVSTSHATMQLN